MGRYTRLAKELKKAGQKKGGQKAKKMALDMERFMQSVIDAYNTPERKKEREERYMKYIEEGEKRRNEAKIT